MLPGTLRSRRPWLAAVAVALLLPATASSQGAGQKRTATSSPGGQVTIYRDEWGVPHIYATTEEDGFYGLGYAQAEDQLERILAYFLFARGELAGAFGAQASAADCAAVLSPFGWCDGKFVEFDAEQRLWRHAEEAKAGFTRMSPQLQKNYRYYAAGMNRYLDDHPAERPKWAPRVEPWDPLAYSRAVLWFPYQAGDGVADCRRGGIDVASLGDVSLGRKSQLVSNEWVLAPWRTADNAMMVLTDPHGGIDGGWVYEFGMDAGGLHLSGYSYGAMPLMVHNPWVAWGLTTGAPDVSDCYEVETDPQDSLRYRYDGEWKTMVTRQVTIPVKDAAPVTRTFAYTMHNGELSPVVARRGNKAYVVSTPYMDQGGMFDEELYRMAHAHNVGEVRDAMRLMNMFPQNVMVGDSHGGSLYIRAGRAPKRPTGYDWSRPVPGNTSRTAWLGIHAVDDLVQIQDPATGYMQNDNIAPDMMFPGSPLTADRYPVDLFNDLPGRMNARGQRTVDVLSRAWNFTVHDAVELALDEKWLGTERWQQALERALSQDIVRVQQATPEFRRFVDRILHFDGNARAESMAARDYYAWREALWLGRPGSRVDTLGSALVGPLLPPELATRLLDGVEQAIADLHRTHGSIDVRLGDDFRIGRDGRSFPLGAGNLFPNDGPRCHFPQPWDADCVSTLRHFAYAEPDSLGQRYAFTGSRMLRLIVFTNPIQSFSLHTFGQSTRRSSPHYMDQARLSSERRLKPTYFEKSELMKHVVSSQTLDVRLP